MGYDFYVADSARQCGDQVPIVSLEDEEFDFFFDCARRAGVPPNGALWVFGHYYEDGRCVGSDVERLRSELTIMWQSATEVGLKGNIKRLLDACDVALGQSSGIFGVAD